MGEYLIVEKFAGLKRVEIQINPITILIGPQASGKSIVVKLAYFFVNSGDVDPPFRDVDPPLTWLINTRAF